MNEALKSTFRSFGDHLLEHSWHAQLARESRIGVLEIGVLNGDTSRILCENTPSHIPIIGIDPVIPDSMNPDLKGSEELILSKTHHYPNYKFIKGYSHRELPKLIAQRQFFDYIFIDGDHEYDAVLLDFVLCHQLLSPGGVVSIHDSTLYRGGPIHWPGPSLLADALIYNQIFVDEYEHIASPYCMTILRKK